jgi:dUTP pyrophosphatase
MQIQFKKLKTTAILPAYQTEHSAGMDICAAIDEPVTLQPLERQLVPCGFAMAIPAGYEVQIRARSGMALKYGIAMANGIGTIDADYRGEVGVILINLGTDKYTIYPGDRIAQMVLARYEIADCVLVDELSETERGDGGFGSTGTSS